jgi:site-specific DNA-methyltransferase (adenine-specific)
MVFNCIDWTKDTESEKIHPTQKPVELLKRLIELFTNEGDVVIDPVAGSGSTLIAAERLNRKAYGFEIKKDFWLKANRWLEEEKQIKKDIKEFGFAKSKLEKYEGATLWTN